MGDGMADDAATEGWLSPRIGSDRIGVGEDGGKIHERIQPLRGLAFETGSLGESGIGKGKKERANEREGGEGKRKEKEREQKRRKKAE